MPASEQIRARGKIIETVDDSAYRVELANGHRCVVRAPKNAQPGSFKTGDLVSVEFHPYDLSRGWIVFL